MDTTSSMIDPELLAERDAVLEAADRIIQQPLRIRGPWMDDLSKTESAAYRKSSLRQLHHSLKRILSRITN